MIMQYRTLPYFLKELERLSHIIHPMSEAIT
jgi:hypothetical protein